jgi:hypothetical protein
VALKIPPAILTYDGWGAWDNVPILAGRVTEPVPLVLAVEGSREWQTAGFPLRDQFRIEKVTRKKDFVEVELRATTVWVKLRFDPAIRNINAAFDALVAPSVESYAAEAYATLAAKFFTGPLQSIPPGKRLELVRFAHLTANVPRIDERTTIKSQTYKGKHYLVVDLGPVLNVYSDLTFTQTGAVAHQLSERLLKTLKAFAELAKDINGLDGLKLEVEIPHCVLLEQPRYYKLQLFALAEDIHKFAEADITNQQFIDNCVVIVDDNRVEVSVAGSGS